MSENDGHTPPPAPSREEPGTSAPTNESDLAPPLFQPGDAIHRYEVRGLLGTGGMGFVLTAFDPELERMVALKLIRSNGTASSRARLRLLREAQALAKLQHPNVVTIYDVGTAGDQVFIAMELVSGRTLSAWLAAEQRSWRAVRDTFVAAGRGLAAAHAVGIVHRDFKPSNVIVSHDRVVVLDFGLALAAGSEHEPEGPPARANSLLQLNVTLTGELVGTPRYMAPEQHVGASATALADQFSFANALWSALYGAQPYAGATAEAIYQEIKKGPPQPPSGSEVPEHLGRALRRALAERPEARWPTLADLLDEIAHDPAATRRRRLIAGAIAAFVVTVGVAAFTLGRTASTPDPCAGASALVESLWDEGSRTRTYDSFRRTGRSNADETFTHIDSLLRERLSDWVSARRDICEATLVRHEQSTEVYEARLDCLGRARSEIAALIQELVSSDADTLDRAAPAAASVGNVGSCRNLAVLPELTPLPKDPEAAEKVERLRADLAHLDALRLLGKIREGQREGYELVERARALGNLPILAAALEVTAWMEIAAGNDAAAIELGYETARVAAETRGYALVAAGMRRVAFALGYDLQRYDAADVAFEAAATAATLAGNPGDVLLALYSDREQVLFQRGDELGLIPLGQIGLALSVRLHGPGSYNSAIALFELSRAMYVLEPSETADQLSRAALETTERILGPQHPVVLVILNDLGVRRLDALDFEGAVPFFERALRANESLLGGDDVGVAIAAHNLAVARRGQRRLSEARALLERAIAIRSQKLGLDHPLLAASLAEIAEIDRLEGKMNDALARLDRAVAIDDRADSKLDLARVQRKRAAVLIQLGRLHDAEVALAAAGGALAKSRADIVERARHLTILADLRRAEGHPEEAVTNYTEAISHLEMRYGTSSPTLIDPLVGRGFANLAASRIDAATTDGDRAEAIAASRPTPADRRAATRLLLAEIRWARRDHEGAVTLARESRAQLAQLHYGLDVLAELDRWLAHR